MNLPFGVMRAPRAVLFGSGQRHALGAVVSRIGRDVLVCTDRRFAASPEMDSIKGDLAAAGLSCRVYDGTEPELPISSIRECVAFCGGRKPDVVVGIGGGSCLDLAKVVSLILTHGEPIDRFYGELKVPGPVLPVVAVPTTAGTGSEVTPVAVLGDSSRELKIGISSPHLIPHTAVCDPDLTATCPPSLTALSGADALTHAIEAFTAIARAAQPNLPQDRVFVGKNALSDHFALTAIKALFEHLPRAVADGRDVVARHHVMFGAMTAGLAFGVAGTAAAHAIQYPVGALTHTAHGLGVAALLPYVMEFNKTACVDALAEIGRAIGVADGSPDRMASDVIGRTRKLLLGIGIPRTLAEIGLPRDKLIWVAERSMLSGRLIDNNPRKLTVESVGSIVSAAFSGATIADGV